MRQVVWRLRVSRRWLSRCDPLLAAWQPTSALQLAVSINGIKPGFRAYIGMGSGLPDNGGLVFTLDILQGATLFSTGASPDVPIAKGTLKQWPSVAPRTLF